MRQTATPAQGVMWHGGVFAQMGSDRLGRNCRVGRRLLPDGGRGAPHVPLQDGGPLTGLRSYRFRFTSSANISSAVVMTRALAWKPRCAVIILVNSCDRSTLELSNAPGVMVD